MENHNENRHFYDNPAPRTALISGVYYIKYKRALRMVLPVVAIIAGVFAILGLIFDNVGVLSMGIGASFITFGVDVTPFAMAAQGVSNIVGAVVQAFAVVTVIFAGLDHFGVDIGEAAPEDSAGDCKRIPLTGPLSEIMVSLIFTVLFLGVPQVFSAPIGGEWIRIFDIDVLRGLWLPIIVWTTAEIATEIFKIIEGRYTLRVAIVGTLGGIVSAVCAFMVFAGESVVNPVFINRVTDSPVGGIEHLESIATRPNVVMLAVMLIIIFIEVMDVVMNALKREGVEA